MGAHLFDGSVHVGCPRGIEARLLSVEGKCCCIDMGRVSHMRLRQVVATSFCMFFVAFGRVSWRVYESSVTSLTLLSNIFGEYPSIY